jgi:signal transduction histidine kinase
MADSVPLSGTLRRGLLRGLHRDARSIPASWLYLGVGATAIAVYFFLPATPQSVVYVAIGAVSVTAIFIGTGRNLAGGRRLPWYLFGFGLLAQVAGDLVFAFYEISRGHEPPSPSLADLFYLLALPPLALGAFLVLRRVGSMASREGVLDTIVVFCGVGLVQWVFFMDPLRHTTFDSRWERIAQMAYPAASVLLLVAVAQLLVGATARVFAYQLLLLSLALWVGANEAYSLDVDQYRGGSWIDALWLSAYVVWGAAALDPSIRGLARRDRRGLPRLTRTRLGLLAAASLTAPAVLVIERMSHHHVHAYAVGVGGAILGVLVLFRLAGLVNSVERARRSERVFRHEAQQAQQLLAYQNEQLLELDRLKDEFVSSISHELRTPLTSISGYVEVLLESETDDERRSHLAIVDRNAHRLLGLVSDLLFAARLQDGGLELERDEVDLTRVVSHAVESARPRAENGGVRLNMALADVPAVRGEPDRLAQLLDNLISNAIKFTPPGGDVTVRLTATDGTVSIEVSDTGIGVPEAERERLFERFFRSQTALERQIQGTGLGLHISKAIVEAHGGRIGVDSNEGAGTTFVVDLPVAG